mmetsp:Transcript_522/g.1225  ORF Transcript_522/g.1225 Transcript_522/m.1225 type:complete len:450 (+) Transcript_522:49-1398(+)
MSSSSTINVVHVHHKSQKSTRNLASLPDDVLRVILDFLNKKSLLQTSQVNKEFYALSIDPSLLAWQSLSLRYNEDTDLGEEQMDVILRRHQKATKACIDLRSLPADTVERLSHHLNLIELKMTSTAATTESATVLSLLSCQKHLTQLSLRGGTRGVTSFIFQVPHLRSLYLAKCKFSNQNLCELVEWCPLLSDLILFNIKFPRDSESDEDYSIEAMKRVLTELPLRRLEIGGSIRYRAPDQRIFKAGHVNPLLQEVCVGCLSGFGDQAMTALASYAPNLEVLIIDKCRLISKDCLIAQLKRLPLLKKFILLSACGAQFEETDMYPLAQALPSIEHVDITLERQHQSNSPDDIQVHRDRLERKEALLRDALWEGKATVLTQQQNSNKLFCRLKWPLRGVITIPRQHSHLRWFKNCDWLDKVPARFKRMMAAPRTGIEGQSSARAIRGGRV